VSVSSGILPVVLALVAGAQVAACAVPPGQYPLEALPDHDPSAEGLRVVGNADLEQSSTATWNLSITVDLETDERHRPLVDFSRVLLRADGAEWRPCDLPDQTDLTKLRLRMEEFQRQRFTVDCENVQRPEHEIEVRIPVSGTGDRAYLELAFSGLR
jgi:hypothetical protein